jgi:hypothetical protein
MTPESSLCLPLGDTEINPEVCATAGKIGKANRATPAGIYLKDPNSSHPHQRQYSLKTEAKKGLQVIIENLNRKVS